MSNYLATGFTPEEEKRIVEFVDKQGQIRAVMIAGAIAGFLFTLAKFGELTSIRRARKRELKGAADALAAIP